MPSAPPAARRRRGPRSPCRAACGRPQAPWNPARSRPLPVVLPPSFVSPVLVVVLPALARCGYTAANHSRAQELMIRKLALGIAAAVLLAACQGKPHYSPTKPHHTPDGFRNNYPHDGKQSFWKWQWQRWTGGAPRDPEGGYHFPLQQPDAAALA